MRFASGTFSEHFLAAAGSTQYLNGGTPFFNSFLVYDPLANVWASGPNLPQGLREVSGAVSGTKFYVFGGYGSSGFSNQVYVISVPEPRAAAILPLLLCAAAGARRHKQFDR